MDREKKWRMDRAVVPTYSTAADQQSENGG